MSKIVDSLNSKTSKKMNWTLKTKLKNHIIIYWENDISFSKIIEEILKSEKKEKLVIITNNSQIPKEISKLDSKYWTNLDWISGKPDDSKVLELANIWEAESFILFREELNDNSDKFLLSYILNIKDHNPKIKIIADIMDSNNKKLFHNAWCTSVINTEEISEKLLYRSLTDWIHRLISDLLECDNWYEIYKTLLDIKWVWKKLIEIIKESIDNNINVIAIWNDKKEIFYDKNYEVKSGDFAFIISENRINQI